MRALVTGAAGFVGSRVAHAMLHAGYEVDAVVRTGAGERLEPIAGEIRLVFHDIGFLGICVPDRKVAIIAAIVRPTDQQQCSARMVPS